MAKRKRRDPNRLACAPGLHCTKTWEGTPALCCHCKSAVATEGHWPDAKKNARHPNDLQPMCAVCHPLTHALISLANIRSAARRHGVIV